MGVGEGHVSGGEICEGGKKNRSSLSTEFRLPIVDNMRFKQVLKAVLCWRAVKKGNRMGQGVLEA